MTTVTSTGGGSGTTATTTSTATAAAQASDTQFLSMLTAELTNQDPMNPTDTSTFTSQLVGMSSLEQQIGTNSKLDGMTALLTQLVGQSSSTQSSTSGS